MKIVFVFLAQYVCRRDETENHTFLFTCMDGWMDGWMMDGWMDGWMDE